MKGSSTIGLLDNIQVNLRQSQDSRQQASIYLNGGGIQKPKTQQKQLVILKNAPNKTAQYISNEYGGDETKAAKKGINTFRSSFYSGTWNTNQNNISAEKRIPINEAIEFTGRTYDSFQPLTNNTKCLQEGCVKRTYKRELCKTHFIAGVMRDMRKEIRNLYRGPDRAYAALDFTGVGHVTEKDFLESQICKRMPYSQEEIKDFFFQTNAFAGNHLQQVPIGGMNFDSFKKTFFPHLYLIQDDSSTMQNNEQHHPSSAQDEDDLRRKRLKSLIENKQEHQEKIQVRLHQLEKKLKLRFASFDSVRKAFLGLDTDYDGYITVEDILRYFGSQNTKDFDFNDLKKLITEKDSTGKGRLGYADFSKWVGNSIHQSEGFYFRHDSIKNPMFEQSMESKASKIKEKCKEEASKKLINETLEKTVIDKIKFQWKTIRKAFSDMNKERDAAIAEDELRFYMQHWGLKLTDEQFSYIFKKFDVDGDGMISYNDFHKAVGSEIHPGESLYFRQDKPHMMRINKCQHPKCWQPTVSLGGNFCTLHSKMYIDNGVQFFQRLYVKIGRGQWQDFLNHIKREAERDEDFMQIFFDKFLQVCAIHGVHVSEKEQELLKLTFPGRNEGDKVRINIQKLYDVHYSNKITKVYKDVNMPDEDKDDQAVDLSGYIGVFHRNNKIEDRQMSNFSMEQLANLFVQMTEEKRNNTLANIMRTIKQIDRDNNGYVTSTELDDILKLTFPFLQNKRLKLLFKDFESIQNKILIDYKRFRDFLINHINSQLEGIKKIESKKRNITEKFMKLRESGYMQKFNHRRSSSNEFTDQQSTSLRASSAMQNLVMNTISGGELIDESPKMKNAKSIFTKRDQRLLLTSQSKDLTQKKSLQEQLMLNGNLSKSFDSSIGNLIQARKIRMLNNQSSITLNQNDNGKFIQVDKVTNDQYISQSVVKDKRYSSEVNTKKNQDHGDDLKKIFKRNNAQPILTNKSQNFNDSTSLARKVIGKINSPYESQISLNECSQIKLSENKRPGSTLAGFHERLSESYRPPQLPKHLELIRAKLSYEWKKVYRILSSQDTNQTGLVQKRLFDEALQQNKVFVSNEELKLIIAQFGENKDAQINYVKLSNALGLHQQSFNVMRATHSMINKMKNESRQQIQAAFISSNSNQQANNQGQVKKFDAKIMNKSLM